MCSSSSIILNRVVFKSKDKDVCKINGCMFFGYDLRFLEFMGFIMLLM